MNVVGIIGYAFMLIGAFGLGFTLGRLVNTEGAIGYESDLLRLENAKLREEVKSLTAEVKHLTDRDAKGRFVKSK